LLDRAQRAFSHAVTARDAPENAATAARDCLEASCAAGQALAEAYAWQILDKRKELGAKLPTLLACVLEGEPKQARWAEPLAAGINAARLRCPWAKLAPDEGRLRWDEVDAQLHWCRKRKLTPTAGPLLDLRPSALPDWLWLWEGDFDEILSQAVDLVRQVL